MDLHHKELFKHHLILMIPPANNLTVFMLNPNFEIIDILIQISNFLSILNFITMRLFNSLNVGLFMLLCYLVFESCFVKIDFIRSQTSTICLS